MENISVREMEEADIPAILTLADGFKHLDKFQTIMHGAINYVMLLEEKIIGISSCFRSKKHWSFHIFNIDIVEKYAQKDMFVAFLEYILKNLHREGGYSVNILCYHGDEILEEALIEHGFTLNDEINKSDFKAYSKRQPVS